MEINFVAMRIKDVSSVADDIVLHSQKVLNEGLVIDVHNL